MRKYTGKIGFCIGEDFTRPADTAIFKTLAGFGSSLLSDGLNKFNTMAPCIKALVTGISVAGPALTVRLRPGDNLMLHKAIGLAKAGDVIVVDTCGSKTNSVMGNLMASAAFAKRIAGIVIDGGIRDVADLREKRYPVFARFVTPAVGDKDGPGEINLPVSCGGVPVLAGDYIVADDDGVVVIPPEFSQAVIVASGEKKAYETKRAKEIESGVYMKSAIDDQLRASGVLGQL